MKPMTHQIRDASLAPTGEEKITWASAHMPLLSHLEKEWATSQPLKGLRVALSIHLEAKTARLALLLKSAGAEVHATGSNPLSTQDDIAAALAASGVSVAAWYDATPDEYERHLVATLSCKPHIVIDDGGDLVSLLHTSHKMYAQNVLGGCEETTTGVLRLIARHAAGSLDFPMININDADMKHLFDNRYGTGQSVWDAITRTTNLVVAGSCAVVAGYGWCGKGVALRARGLGARVIVTEVDPIKAVEAMMDGHEVMTMIDAAPRGDVFITVTGCRDVITSKHMPLLKDGAILCNAGHFDVEVSVAELRAAAVKRFVARKNIDGYVMPCGKTIYLLAEGRLVNLAAGDGHPVEIMDLSFALQAMSAVYVAQNASSLAAGVHSVPVDIDKRVATLKLGCMNRKIDNLTPEQTTYLSSWGS